MRVMSGSLSVGRIGGIEVALHYTWFVMTALISLSLARHITTNNREWDTSSIWFAAVTMAILFFISLLAHELSHVLVARRRNLPVSGVTLFALGGLAHIDKPARRASDELLVAIVGPVASLVIGFICLGAATAMDWSPGGGSSRFVPMILGWSGSMNGAVAVFNFLPAYPLDGGRILRSVLWVLYGNESRATAHAMRLGRAVAGILIGAALWRVFFGPDLSGLWLALIGWSLLSLARVESQRIARLDPVQVLTVADVMSRDCATVSPDTTLDTIVRKGLLTTDARCVAVERAGLVIGLLTPEQLLHIEQNRWFETRAMDAMRAVQSLEIVTPDTPAMQVLRTMRRQAQIPVLVEGHLEGIVTRGRLVRLIDSRKHVRY